ncbi:hypothetical protein PQX77_004369 [Marasmius sp. AFHP31]|nr:hypothetical protein PQX77_004369 [Marasmius sp. AFHP31]
MPTYGEYQKSTSTCYLARPHYSHQDWKYHKRYCGKKTYTFKIKLVGSTKPVITRTVDVPSWYTFQWFHFVIQYAFGPWQQCHPHEFSYETETPKRRGGIPDQPALRILPESGAPRSLAGGRSMFEKELKLSDIYDRSGKYHSLVVREGAFLPLKYLYEFGKWEHLVTFKGEKMATVDRPLFSKAVGYPPAEDVGGVSGWEEVKKAFAAEHPTARQRQVREWTTERMGYKDRAKDTLTVGEKPYNPFNEVNVTVMNYEGRWENHLEGYREDLGEQIDRPDYDDDDDYLFDSEDDDYL